MPTEVPRIVTRLQLGEKNPSITVAELVKDFGEEYATLSYDMGKDRSKLDTAFDYIKENPEIAQSLCDVLCTSNDFEDQLGIREQTNMRDNFWHQAIGVAISKEQKAIFAKRRSQKIKEGAFNDLPEGRKYEIMHYCACINKELFTEGEIESYKPVGESNWTWITALRQYNPRKAFEEMIQGKHYHNMSLIYGKKIFESGLIQGNVEESQWREELGEDPKSIFLRELSGRKTSVK